jgi:hypothetical protein
MRLFFFAWNNLKRQRWLRRSAGALAEPATIIGDLSRRPENFFFFLVPLSLAISSSSSFRANNKEKWQHSLSLSLSLFSFLFCRFIGIFISQSS